MQPQQKEDWENHLTVPFKDWTDGKRYDSNKLMVANGDGNGGTRSF